MLVTPLAWVLARRRGLWVDLVVSLALLPLVLPPTVLGFYLLLALAPGGPVAALFGPLAFTFPGLVAGSMIYSLPFALQPIRDAFLAQGQRPLAAAMSLGAAPFDAFVTVALPRAGRGFLLAALLAFAHTVGEFGVVLMIGGNIPGRTRVLSIAIWDHVEAGEWRQAHILSASLVGFALVALILLQRLARRGTAWV